MNGYKRLPTDIGDSALKHAEAASESSSSENHDARVTRPRLGLLLFLSFSAGAMIGFASAVLSVRSDLIPRPLITGDGQPQRTNSLSRIPLSSIELSFTYNISFSEEPPKGPGSDQVAEPVWDALIPYGLGYFKDPDLAPEVSLPTVIHQLHCLYIIRRGFYSESDELGAFDFGRDRSDHAGHCFDYLAQSLSCQADSTVEPAIPDEHGFVGADVLRECRDFDALKQFLEEHRVFNASGFLAHGLVHESINKTA